MKITPQLNKGGGDEVLVNGSNFTFTVKLSHTAVGMLGDDALEEIAKAIAESHDPSKPFKKTYEFTSYNTEANLDRMVDWIKRNRP